MAGDSYISCSPLFCDGFGFKMSQVDYEAAKKNENKLKNYLNKYVKDLVFKNVVIGHREGSTFAWITLSPETSHITSHTSTRLNDSLLVVRTFARMYLGCSLMVTQ